MLVASNGIWFRLGPWSLAFNQHGVTWCHAEQCRRPYYAGGVGWLPGSGVALQLCHLDRSNRYQTRLWSYSWRTGYSRKVITIPSPGH